MRHQWVNYALLLFASVVMAGTAAAAGFEADIVPFSDKFPVEIRVADRESVSRLASLGIDIDAVEEGVVRAYVNQTELESIELLGYAVEPVPNQALRMWRLLEEAEGEKDTYHDYDAMTTYLQGVVTDHPTTTRLVSIGQTVQGRELWFIKITDNPDAEEDEPEFKYIATMHGDEPVGTENCLKLVDLLTDNYDSGTPDPDLELLVDEVELWIMPMMNPDGNNAGGRYNANGEDLNRNFPDSIDDPVNTPAGREPETGAVMMFSDSMSFDLSANFHGGALVVNYPSDNRPERTPDDSLFISMSEAYSIHNTPMWNSPSFYHGITNGWDWYETHGNMQDWNYDFMHNKEVTIEISNDKWPPASELPGFWDDNRESMIAYLEYCLRGVRGVVTDSVTGAPLLATVSVGGNAWDDWTDPDVGDYHRILNPGSYSLEFSCPGYVTKQVPGVVVTADSATVLDVELAVAEAVTVTGTVASDTMSPLPASVDAYYHPGGELADSTSTDPSDGSYSLDLTQGEYDLEVRADGFAPEYLQATILSDTTFGFVLVPVSGMILVISDDSGMRLLSKSGESGIEYYEKDATLAASDIASDLEMLGYSAVEEPAATTDPKTWGAYDLVVWSSGSNTSPVSSVAYRDNLIDFVSADGLLLIEGGETAYDAASSPGYPNFADSVLHTDVWHGDNVGALGIDGSQTGHPIATEPNPLPGTIAITYSGYGDEDAARPAGGAYIIYGTASYPADAGVLVYDDGGAGGNGGTVFFPFSYSAVSDRGVARDLLENAIIYLKDDLASVGNIPVANAGVDLNCVSPNPFGPATKISFSAVSREHVRLAIYEVRGRAVRTLIDHSVEPGLHEITWDGRDASGREMGPGIYFCRLTGAETERTHKTVKLR
ncbi:MAG: M14 family zinc carboxypeptidase [Candidatus Eisenbacteria bacterium]